jgi:hypothetical protein
MSFERYFLAKSLKYYNKLWDSKIYYKIIVIKQVDGTHRAYLFTACKNLLHTPPCRHPLRTTKGSFCAKLRMVRQQCLCFIVSVSALSVTCKVLLRGSTVRIMQSYRVNPCLVISNYFFSKLDLLGPIKPRSF